MVVLDKNHLLKRNFWANVCKTVRPMLLDSCLSVLSVTLMYCCQFIPSAVILICITAYNDSGHPANDDEQRIRLRGKRDDGDNVSRAVVDQ